MDIEETLRQARKKGYFDNLPGKGKPLNLSNRKPSDPVVGIAKEAGYLPEWMALGKEIDAADEAAERLATQWRVRRDAYLREAKTRLDHDDPEQARRSMRRMRDERDDLAATLARRWVRLRKSVERYNMMVPVAHKQRILPSPKRLLEAFLAESPDYALSEDAASLVARPPDSSSSSLLEKATREIQAEQGDRPSMSSERAEALLGFKSRYAGWMRKI
jgi:hypothetical protein